MVAKELLYDVLSSLEYNYGEEVKEFDNLLNGVCGTILAYSICFLKSCFQVIWGSMFAC